MASSIRTRKKALRIEHYDALLAKQRNKTHSKITRTNEKNLSVLHAQYRGGVSLNRVKTTAGGKQQAFLDG